MPAIEDRPSYDEDMMSIALAGITQRQKKKRSRTYTFVQKRSIDFTEEIWSIIEAHRKLPGIQDNLRETIYKGLLLLKEKKTYNDRHHDTDAEMTSRHNRRAIHERRVGTTRYSLPKPITICRI